MRYQLLFCSFFFFCLTATAETDMINRQFLEAEIQDVKKAAALPSGTAIAVVKEDKIIFEAYLGFQHIENQIPVDAQTQFYIASVTKPFTALNALLDSHKRAMSLQTNVRDMFPDFSLSNREQVTIAELLTHRSSINNLPLVLATAYSGVHSPDSLTRLVNQFSSASSEPVGQFKYTNVGYNIYSIYADRVFNQSWQSRLQSQVFAPAAMQRTSAYRSGLDEGGHIALPYSLLSDERATALYLEKSDATMHSAGGIFSTASDLGRFLIAQLNNGVIDGKAIFPPSVIARSQQQQAETNHRYQDFERDGYAWGWYTGDYKGNAMLHHFGGFAGAHAHLSFMPSKRIGIVVLNNEDFLSTRLTSIIADYLYGALLAEEGIETKIAERIEGLKTKLAGLDGMLAKEQNKLLSREWILTLDADEYEGVYTHSLLGDIEIRRNNKKTFDVTWGAMKSDSLGMNEANKIRVELEPNNGTVITFNVEHAVMSLTYAGIEFTKTR